MRRESRIDSGPDVVDDRTFDLLQALTSSLETLDAYRVFAVEDPESVFAVILEDERRQAMALLDALRQRLGG
jgi:hypothetical protein